MQIQKAEAADLDGIEKSMTAFATLGSGFHREHFQCTLRKNKR